MLYVEILILTYLSSATVDAPSQICYISTNVTRQVAYLASKPWFRSLVQLYPVFFFCYNDKQVTFHRNSVPHFYK